MKIDERSVGGVTILDLKGKMLIGEGDELLREKINSLVENGKSKIVLNLAEVPYVDSAGRSCAAIRRRAAKTESSSCCT